jgi:hypothetical protein
MEPDKNKVYFQVLNTKSFLENITDKENELRKLDFVENNFVYYNKDKIQQKILEEDSYKKNLFILCIENGIVLGFIQLLFDESSKTINFEYIEVNANLWGKGIGSKLISTFFNFVITNELYKEYKIKEINLEQMAYLFSLTNLGVQYFSEYKQMLKKALNFNKEFFINKYIDFLYLTYEYSLESVVPSTKYLNIYKEELLKENSNKIENKVVKDKINEIIIKLKERKKEKLKQASNQKYLFFTLISQENLKKINDEKFLKKVEKENGKFEIENQKDLDDLFGLIGKDDLTFHIFCEKYSKISKDKINEIVFNNVDRLDTFNYLYKKAMFKMDY